MRDRLVPLRLALWNVNGEINLGDFPCFFVLKSVQHNLVSFFVVYIIS